MKSTCLVASLGLLTVAFPAAIFANDWQVADLSKVEFTFTQQGTRYRGRFAEFSAGISIDPAEVTAGSISGVVQTASVNTRDNDRDATLAEVDWLDSNNYPEAIFQSATIRSGEDGSYVADGTLTIKGTSHPAEMGFTFEANGATAIFAGSLQIDRFSFRLGDGWNDTDWVGRHIDVKIELNLTQQ